MIRFANLVYDSIKKGLPPRCWSAEKSPESRGPRKQEHPQHSQKALPCDSPMLVWGRPIKNMHVDSQFFAQKSQKIAWPM
ncbi:MAG: hypothetical protein D6814_05305 [Calditrichaeota bacterium]|nr:MAG: hypothetical protein D6814_05305 [Calditrichota bacterium]